MYLTFLPMILKVTVMSKNKEQQKSRTLYLILQGNEQKKMNELLVATVNRQDEIIEINECYTVSKQSCHLVIALLHSIFVELSSFLSDFMT